MVFVGISFAYCLGLPFTNFRWIGLVCALIPCLCSFLMIFCKESPVYLLSKGKFNEAVEALQFFRGKYSDTSGELESIRNSLEESFSRKAKLSDLKRSYNLKPFLMALGLMVLQQFLGINAVTFNLASIFEKAGSDLSPSISSIIIGLTQVGGTIVGSLLMDRAGRKPLLIISVSFMIVSIAALGLFFFFLENNASVAANNGWLPLASLILYVVAYAIGCGPIPWLMMGELFSPEIKEIAGSIVTMSNWTSAFITTLMFQPLQMVIHDYGVYWMFCGFCIMKLVFCILYVYETKGKTLQEISAYFGKLQPLSEMASQE
ncbi:Facilitated trehalose transporter Tret1 [Armadillidium nasatum]|uniref:Facilitated trehalose transporter Tret1 n=1 Tax=Armadillidium nasatum TaxID=96803 RepID=A0A5N5TCS5_9CRUS|nr:Facilitated trehalose transporter Tret1 [Armadillidium nasatum]